MEAAIYSERVVLSKLDNFAAKHGWMPQPHTDAEISEFKETVDKITETTSNSKSASVELARPVSQRMAEEIYRFAENEQVMCGLDNNYWEARYAMVCDEQGRISKFKNRKSQEVFDSIVADFDEREVSIEMMILKGRQVGITTKTGLKFLHRLAFVPHTQAVMASVQAEKSELIARILDIAYSYSPWWLVPRRLPKGKFDNGSVLSIQSGMQATGIAQGWTPTCLVPTTLIRCADGFFKPISLMKDGDAVVTHTGRCAKVKKAFKTRPDGDITRVLKIWGNHRPLECTTDHLIDTPDGWLEASELSVGDYVSYPVRTLDESLETVIVTSQSRGKVSPKRKKNLEIPANYDLGYLCGLYLAEGSLHKSGIGTKKTPYYSEVIFTVHKREVKDRVASLRKVLGKDQHLKVKPHGENGAQIKASVAWLARFIASELGERTNKHVPDWAWSGTSEFCWGITRGYLDGDGHCEKNSNNVIAPTICQQIAYQMRDLIASLYLGWPSIYFIPAHIQDGMKKQDTWRLVLSGRVGAAYRRKCDMPFRKPKGIARHWRYGPNMRTVEVQVESISDGWSNSFWDLEIDDEDHSFTTEQCSVHNCIHISELADIPKPEKQIEEGLLRATHSSRNLFMVLEGTGGGNTGWLADTWRSAKRDYPLGLHRLCPIFLPWFTATDLYPEADWLRKCPIPEGFMGKRLDATKKHVQRCEAFVRNTFYMRRIYGGNWTMPIEQQWFYDFNYRQAVNNHTQRIWMAQMPADDFEALTGKHDSVFEEDVMQDLERNIYEIRTNRKTGEEVQVRRQPVEAYAITGHDIDEHFYPDDDEIDESKPIIQVRWASNRGMEYEWEMLPLLWLPEDKEENTMDRLLIYSHPERGNQYTLGIDTADGLGKEDEERTVLSLAKNRFFGGYDEQVAEFCIGEGTLIITPNGVKRIETIRPGEFVIDRSGRSTEVRRISKTIRNSALKLFTGLSTNEPLTITLDNEVATSEGWRRADELKVGTWLRYPVRQLRDIGLAPVTIDDYVSSINDQVPKTLEFKWTRDFGFTCGLYLAEGCVGLDGTGKERNVTFTLHKREATPWRSIIERGMPGINVIEKPKKKANAHVLRISSTPLGKWFAKTFGRTEAKHIPEWVWNAPREFIEGLAHGMMAGDGSFDKKCAASAYVSVLPSLTVGLRDLVLSLGWGLGTIRRWHRSIAQDAWIVYFYGETAERFFSKDMIRTLPCESQKRRSPQFKWGWNKEWIYAPVRKIEKAYGGSFYDLTTDPFEPSFCTIQAAVHNCSNRINAAQAVAFAACIGAYWGPCVPDSRGILYAIEQVGRPGETCQHQLKMMGFHRHYKPKRFDSTKIKDEIGKKQGWWSSAWSVPILMTRFVEAINGGWYVPKSRWLIEELKTLERRQAAGKSKMVHRSGQFDDRVRAAAQSFFCAHDLDVLADRAQKRYGGPPKSNTIQVPRRAGQISVGGWD